MSMDHCRAEIENAGGRPLSGDDVQKMWEDIQGRADSIRRDRPSLSEAALLKAAADDLTLEAQMAARIEMRNAKMNLVKRVRRREGIVRMAQALGGARSADLALAIEAKLVGINTAVRGARLSVDAQGVALTRQYLGGLSVELEQAGLYHAVRNGSLDRDIARELWRLSSEGGNPGISGNKAALRAAEIFHRYQRLAVEGLNREGAWIGRIDGYITRQGHDADRMVKAGYPAWRAAMLRHLDERSFEAVTDRERFLKGVYQGLVTGVHLDADSLTGFKDPAFKGPSNVAKKLSQARTLHFKDADAWMDYQAEFGAPNIIETMLRGLDKAAKATALMREYGTNPRAEFDADIQHLQETWRDRDMGAVMRLNDRVKPLNNQMDELDGTAATPVNRTLARIGAGMRTWQSMSKLGGVLLSALTDVPYKAGELKYQGINLMESYADGFASIARGRGTGEVREIMDLLGAGLEGVVGHMASRFDGGDHVPGMLSSVANHYFRWTGLTYWTDAQRAGAEIIMSRHLGTLQGQEWDALPHETSRILSMFDIGKAEWEALAGVEWAQANGKAHLTPDRARLLSDEAADALMPTRVKDISDAFTARLDRAQERIEVLTTRLEKLDVRLSKAASVPKDGEAAEIRFRVEGWKRGANGIRRVRDAIVDMRDGKTSTNRTLLIMRQHLDWARSANLDLGAKMQQQRTRMEKKAAKAADDLEELPVRIAEIERQLLDQFRQLEEMPQRYQDDLDKARAEVRDDLALKLTSYFSDRGMYAVLQTGARERAILRQGTRAGTPVGEALRTLTQFKAFPVAIITKVWGRDIHGGAEGWGKAAGIFHLMVMTTVFGYLAGVAKDMAKGRTPRDPTDPKTWAAAFAQGGGAGIYGDFIVGKYSRFGNTALETVAGPTLTSAGDIVNLWAATRGGDGRAATALRIAMANTPFANLFWLRPAIDYGFLYQVQEAMNPGFLRRMERRLKEENGQTFIIPPSSVVTGD